MRVLVISHTVFCQTSNMGRTLSAFFQGFNADDIAQFYIHSEVPTDDKICKNYYRITDMEVVKSIFSLKEYGEILQEKDICNGLSSSRTDTGMIGNIYQRGRKRTPLIYLLRNTYWKMGHWYTKKLKKWIADFNPDVIFLASGDYSFIYRVAYRIAEDFQKPLVVSCYDDFYLNNKNSNSALGRWEHGKFMKVVSKTMAKAQSIVCICDSMAEKYEELFKKKCYTLYTACSQDKINFKEDSQRIAYFGNLGYGRDVQLIELGKALLNCCFEKKLYIDVYSGERRKEITENLHEGNGLRFHGHISAEEMREIMSECMAVIHTESFDTEIVECVKFSVSTKIAESLAIGPCLIAYGPMGIASMDYLIKNRAAYAITSPDKLVSGLKEVISNASLRQEIVYRARKLANENHNEEVNSKNIRAWLQEAISGEKE